MWGLIRRWGRIQGFTAAAQMSPLFVGNCYFQYFKIINEHMTMCFFYFSTGEMIDKLTITFNRTRQAVITRELTEIVSGAAALD